MAEQTSTVEIARLTAGAAEGTPFYGDPTFWATVAVFTFLGILVWKKIPETIAKSLDDRADKIRSELDEAKKLREQASSMLAEAEKAHAQASKLADKIIADAKVEAENMATSAREDLKERMERREKMAAERIARAEAEAEQQVRSAAADAAAAAAAKIMSEQPKAAQFNDALSQIKKALS